MLIPVLIISSLVHIYSVSYMSSDPQIKPVPCTGCFNCKKKT